MIGLLVGGVVLLAAIGLTLWLVLSGGRSAEDTVDGFLAAAEDGDTSAAQEYACDAIDAQIEGDAEDFGGFEFQVTSVTEDGDSATAQITVTEVSTGQNENFTLGLTKNDDGDFEVCTIS